MAELCIFAGVWTYFLYDYVGRFVESVYISTWTTASQSIKNWISPHLAQKQQRLKFSDLTNLSLSNDIIPARNYWLHLWLWHVFLWSNQLCIQILSFSISETSIEFVIFFLFLQPQLLQIHLSPANLTTAIHFTLASHKQISKTSTHSKFIGTCHYKHFKI